MALSDEPTNALKRAAEDGQMPRKRVYPEDLRLPMQQRFAELAEQSGGGAPALTVAVLHHRYHQVLKIGEGTFGEVFILFDTVAQTYLTMKRMHKLLSLRRRSLGIHRCTFREVELLAALQHPNLVQVLDYHILADGSLVMFMPLIAHDLSSLLRRWPPAVRVGEASAAPATRPRMPLHVIKCLFRQLLAGMAYLHKHKVVHRDLKPSNVMVDSSGIVKLIDFGWSRFCAAAGAMTGPPCITSFRPPEVLVGGHTHYTFSLDMWCCGCILFEMLTGGVPFTKSRNEAECLANIVDWLGSPLATSEVYYRGTERCPIALSPGRPDAFSHRCSSYGIKPTEVVFLRRMLCLEPGERATAEALLCDGWFTTAPMMCVPSAIPLPTTNTFRLVEVKRREMEH